MSLPIRTLGEHSGGRTILNDHLLVETLIAKVLLRPFLGQPMSGHVHKTVSSFKSSELL